MWKRFSRFCGDHPHVFRAHDILLRRIPPFILFVSFRSRMRSGQRPADRGSCDVTCPILLLTLHSHVVHLSWGSCQELPLSWMMPAQLHGRGRLGTVNEVPFTNTSRAQGSSSQRGQQSPSSVTGFEQVTGGHSICQQSISPYYKRPYDNSQKVQNQTIIFFFKESHFHI